MKIYIASKAHHRPYWRRMRDEGLPINSRWIDVDDKFTADPAGLDFTELWTWCIEDVIAADVLIIHAGKQIHAPSAGQPEVLKGALVELGVALAHGKRIIAVGAPEDFLENGTWLHHPAIDHRWQSDSFMTVRRVIEELVSEQEG